MLHIINEIWASIYSNTKSNNSPQMWSWSLSECNPKDRLIAQSLADTLLTKNTLVLSGPSQIIVGDVLGDGSDIAQPAHITWSDVVQPAHVT